MERVTGLGGVFFKCSDLKLMKEWYNKHFMKQIIVFLR